MQDRSETQLSEELEQMIRARYAPEAQASVRALLLEYAGEDFWWKDAVDRVLYDVLYRGGGDPDRVAKLTEIARRDPRDVMAQEYFWRNGKSYAHEWARGHLVNRNSPVTPEPSRELLATALFILRAQKPIGRDNEIRPPGRRQQLPSLILTLSTWPALQTLIGHIEMLAERSGSQDISSLLEFRYPAPSRTILVCVEANEPCSLKHEEKVLSWSGNASYWNKCSLLCQQLEKTSGTTPNLLFGDGMSQLVRVALQPPGTP